MGPPKPRKNVGNPCFFALTDSASAQSEHKQILLVLQKAMTGSASAQSGHKQLLLVRQKAMADTVCALQNLGKTLEILAFLP